MPKKIIKDLKIIDDNISHLNADAPLIDSEFTVPYKRFVADAENLQANRNFCGVSVNGVEYDIYQIGSELAKLPLICLEFPQYVDGQCYSFARLLRTRYGFVGELRAIGNVLQDQLNYMHRCGINAFEIEAGKDINQAIKGISDFSVSYQPANSELC